MDKRNAVQVSSLPLTSIGLVTFIIFLILKLVNVLPESFSWFWVFFPLWLPFAIEGVLFIIILIVLLLIDRGY